ncbi:glutamate receptor ionotropic, delta-2-like [Penaeus japonicus]|uniref:glutamate receptor ionotropic, delta-2-like n=1 Tax=Penaeus japonicus TaxID=27405 RepID=UPI001C70BE95|nr:glutamate receptor ionotropic, delta-2-like [Penaeus japonicus]
MTGLGYVVSEDRFKDFGVGEYLYLDESSAAYARPRLDQHTDGFLRPYTPMVGAVDWLLNSLHVPVESLAQNAAWTSVMWTVYTFLAQSVRKVPQGDSVRMVSGIWLLACLILASVYRSNLKAMLILPKVTVPFDSLDQLVDTDLPVWVALDSVLYNVAMLSPPNTSLGKLSQMFIGTDQPINIPWGVRDLIAGKHVVTGPKSALVQILHGTFSQTGKCANYIMSEAFLKSTMLSFIFPKGSPLKKEVDGVIVRLREAGILDHIHQKGVSNATECLKPITTRPSNEIRSLDLRDVFGVFLVYLGGIALAILIFAMEMLGALIGYKPQTQVAVDLSSRYQSNKVKDNYSDVNDGYADNCGNGESDGYANCLMILENDFHKTLENDVL